MQTDTLPEEMLRAYLGLCANLWNRRLTSSMPFNEALVCYYIAKAESLGQSHVTATWLCEQTQIVKSQMNRILNTLSEKGILCRRRSQQDKRLVFLTLNPDQENLFLQEHCRNLRLVRQLQEKFGLQRSRELTALLGDFVEMLQNTDLAELK